MLFVLILNTPPRRVVFVGMYIRITGLANHYSCAVAVGIRIMQITMQLKIYSAGALPLSANVKHELARRTKNLTP